MPEIFPSSISVAGSRRSAFLAVFSLTTLVALIYPTLHFIGFGHAPDALPWWKLTLWHMAHNYVWVVVAPVVFWLGERLPFRREVLVRNVTLHFVAGSVFSVVRIVVFASSGRLLGITLGWTEKTYGQELEHLTWMFFHLGLFSYFTVLGIGYACEYYSKYRERELHAARLNEQLVRAQLDALKAQLHPHFLFNTLNAVVGLIRNNENKAAVRMTTELGELLRHVLAHSEKREIPLREELEFTERYLAIQRERFSDRLTIETEIDPETLDVDVPTLILQPVVENAFRHGISNLTGRGTVAVSAHRENGLVRLAVRNDGPGVSEGGGSDGVGLTNTKTRLLRLYGEKAAFRLRNVPGGVVAEIDLPYRRHEPEAHPPR